MLHSVAPDAFLFENVPGLLNMEGGAVFEEVVAELRKVAKEVCVWRVSAETYGVPQRRKRIVIVGFRTMKPFPLQPGPLTGELLGEPVSVREALDDLPALVAGEDGTNMRYRHAPLTAFQKLMRGTQNASEFIGTLNERSPS